MPKNIVEMRIALRVLSAVMDHHEPDPADVAELHRLAPFHPEEPIDEMACEVIQSELRKDEGARARRSSLGLIESTGRRRAGKV
jgi:hypothetical protein